MFSTARGYCCKNSIASAEKKKQLPGIKNVYSTNQPKHEKVSLPNCGVNIPVTTSYVVFHFSSQKLQQYCMPIHAVLRQARASNSLFVLQLSRLARAYPTRCSWQNANVTAFYFIFLFVPSYISAAAAASYPSPACAIVPGTTCTYKRQLIAGLCSSTSERWCQAKGARLCAVPCNVFLDTMVRVWVWVCWNKFSTRVRKQKFTDYVKADATGNSLPGIAKSTCQTMYQLSIAQVVCGWKLCSRTGGKKTTEVEKQKKLIYCLWGGGICFMRKCCRRFSSRLSVVNAT